MMPNPSPRDAVAAIHAQLAAIPQPAPAQRRRAVQSNSSVNVPACNIAVGSAAIAQLCMQAPALPIRLPAPIQPLALPQPPLPQLPALP